MSDSADKQQQVEHLLDDIEYLALEAESLKRIIDAVPYDERPPGRRSMQELLVLIDYAQTAFFRPAVEHIIEAGEEPFATDQIDPNFTESFSFDAGASPDIDTILSRLARHRKDFSAYLHNLGREQWDNTCLYEGQEISLPAFLNRMVDFEREKLKEIADQVMLLAQQREAQRQIDEKREERDRFQDLSS